MNVAETQTSNRRSRHARAHSVYLLTKASQSFACHDQLHVAASLIRLAAQLTLNLATLSFEMGDESESRSKLNVFA